MRSESVAEYRADYPAYAAACQFIVNKASHKIPFQLNSAQIYIWSEIKRCLTESRPVRLIVLKPRQTGSSTFFEGLADWVLNLFGNKKGLILGNEEDTSKNLLNIFRYFNDNKPNAFRAHTRLDNRNEIWFDRINSRMLVDTAGNKNAGKSYTYNFIHLTEVGSWELNGVDCRKVWESVSQSLPDLPGTFLIAESTAEELGDFFEALWREENDFLKIFIPWFADAGYRIENTPRFTLSKKADDLYGDEVEEYENLAIGLPRWHPKIKDIDNEIYCRLAWRRWAIVNKCNREVSAFRRNYPSKPDDAFAVSGGHVFNQEALSMMKATAPEEIYYKPSAQYYEAIGRSKMGEMRDFKTASENFIKYIESAVSGVLIHEMPDEKYSYVLGADCSEGLATGDFQAAVILKMADHKLTESASLNLRIPPIDFAYLLYALGRWYNGALLNLEINERGGAAALNTLQRDLNYPNLYYQQNWQSANYREEKNSYGWITNAHTKSTMVEEMQQAIQYGLILFRTKELIAQLQRYKKWLAGKQKTLKMGCQSGNDDLATAAMIARMTAKAYYERKEFHPIIVKPGTWQGVMDENEKAIMRDIERRFML